MLRDPIASDMEMRAWLETRVGLRLIQFICNDQECEWTWYEPVEQVREEAKRACLYCGGGARIDGCLEDSDGYTGIELADGYAPLWTARSD